MRKRSILNAFILGALIAIATTSENAWGQTVVTPIEEPGMLVTHVLVEYPNRDRCYMKSTVSNNVAGLAIGELTSSITGYSSYINGTAYAVSNQLLKERRDKCMKENARYRVYYRTPDGDTKSLVTLTPVARGETIVIAEK